MKLLLASDMDGTLLNEEHTLDIHTEKQIKHFSSLGNIFIIATGRLDHDITYIEKELGVQGDFRISQNGAVIRNGVGELLLHQPIKQEITKKLCCFLTTLDLRVEASTIDNRYFPSPRNPQEVAEYYDSSIISARFYEDVPKLSICTFLIFGTEEKFRPIKKFVEQELNGDVEAFMTSKESFEIVAKGVSKGAALSHLFARIDARAIITAAIGDSENDCSMFPIVDHSFVMKNANESIKTFADIEVGTVGECLDILMKREVIK